MEIIGKCLAGHFLHGKKMTQEQHKKYDNPLADYIALVIAEHHALQSITPPNNACTRPASAVGMQSKILESAGG